MLSYHLIHYTGNHNYIQGNMLIVIVLYLCITTYTAISDMAWCKSKYKLKFYGGLGDPNLNDHGLVTLYVGIDLGQHLYGAMSLPEG